MDRLGKMNLITTEHLAGAAGRKQEDVAMGSFGHKAVQPCAPVPKLLGQVRNPLAPLGSAKNFLKQGWIPAAKGKAELSTMS